MSIQAVAWALEQDIPARPKLVLVAIANHANHTDGYCWLKAETISKEAACTPRSIYNFVGALIRNGFIRKTLRKGDDGKQRATDYWILFNREDKPWDRSASLEADEAEDEACESDVADDHTQDIDEPDAQHADGKIGEPPAQEDTRQATKLPAGSSGPAESAFTRKRIAEPSKTNPKESSAREALKTSPPRGYKPPPPQPAAAVVHNGKTIFVYQNSRAYEAWAKIMARQNGVPKWNLVTRALIDGEWRTGWYFPSLFPPGQPTDPPSESSNAA